MIDSQVMTVDFLHNVMNENKFFISSGEIPGIFNFSAIWFCYLQIAYSANPALTIPLFVP
jgi:hypothetical protein